MAELLRPREKTIKNDPQQLMVWKHPLKTRFRDSQD